MGDGADVLATVFSDEDLLPIVLASLGIGDVASLSRTCRVLSTLDEGTMPPAVADVLVCADLAEFLSLRDRFVAAAAEHRLVLTKMVDCFDRYYGHQALAADGVHLLVMQTEVDVARAEMYQAETAFIAHVLDFVDGKVARPSLRKALAVGSRRTGAPWERSYMAARFRPMTEARVVRRICMIPFGR